MWICQRCQTENKDTVHACRACGTVRAAGRFGSAPTQYSGMGATAPRVTPAQPVQTQEPPKSGPVQANCQPPEENTRVPRGKKGGGLARLVGVLLCVLLPLLTVLLAWQQKEVLLPVLTPLFTGPDAPAWLSWTCYGALSLTAALLALLPGLWTLLLNKRN